MQWYLFEPSTQNINTMQWHLFRKPPIGKMRGEYCLQLFLRRNENGVLTPLLINVGEKTKRVT